MRAHQHSAHPSLLSVSAVSNKHIIRLIFLLTLVVIAGTERVKIGTASASTVRLYGHVTEQIGSIILSPCERYNSPTLLKHTTTQRGES